MSDAIKAYNHLMDLMINPRQLLGPSPSLVVNNSWMAVLSTDFPVGDPGNYSDNPDHPFYQSVGLLEAAGADILFAAGNCGAHCPALDCDGVTTNMIYGANSHPQVLTVAGVDTTFWRVGYSSIGPGRLTNAKPDIAGYTHFKGSGALGAADTGTSTATAVVSGVVAAVRSKRPYLRIGPNAASTWPAAIRSLVTSTAIDLGPSGFDYHHGHGVVDGYALKNKLCLFDFDEYCKSHPWHCIDIRLPEFSGSPISGLPDLTNPTVLRTIARLAARSGARSGEINQLELAYMIGLLNGQHVGTTTAAASASSQGGQPAGSKDGCGCDDKS
jgi:subtilisin family serine protease